jgi:hypothetical protein
LEYVILLYYTVTNTWLPVAGIGSKINLNPVYKLAQQYRLMQTPSDFSNVTYRSENGREDQAAFWKRVKQFQKISKETLSMSRRFKRSQQKDISVRAAYLNLDWDPRTAMDMCIEWSFFDFEHGESPDVSSLVHGEVCRKLFSLHLL